jgi:hypothetical protein
MTSAFVSPLIYSHSFAISPAHAPRGMLLFPALQLEGAGNAGRPMRPIRVGGAMSVSLACEMFRIVQIISNGEIVVL